MLKLFQYQLNSEVQKKKHTKAFIFKLLVKTLIEEIHRRLWTDEKYQTNIIH